MFSYSALGGIDFQRHPSREFVTYSGKDARTCNAAIYSCS
jgi:hypothetical protein